MTFHFGRRAGWLALAISALLLTGGCAVPTPYQEAADGFGYAEQQIEDNRYRVSFAGNATTPRQTVENYLLYRAAELAVENDYDYFTVVDRGVDRSTRYYSQGFYDDPFPFTYRDRRRAFFGPRLVTTTSRPVDEFAATADVVMHKGEKPKEDVHAYDARDVLLRLQPTIVRPSS